LQALQAPPTELKATDDRPDDPAQAHDPARPDDRGRIRRRPVELNWRLERASWGRGFATEGTRACLEFRLTREHWQHGAGVGASMRPLHRAARCSNMRAAAILAATEVFALK
jgi:hypothetical protein